MNRPLQAVLFAFVALAFIGLPPLGCSNAEATDEVGCKTGANAPWAAPIGTAFVLPSGVELVGGEISRNVTEGPCVALQPIEYGGDQLPACITFKNTTAVDITVKFPAGLVFLSKDPETQNGIILQEHDVVVPAGETTSFRFALFCLNEHCYFGDTTTRFTFGNVSSDPVMLELVALVRGRKMDRNAVSTAFFLVRAVWDVTGGRGLSAERKKQITDVPDGT